jgi:hypothetical protein
MTHLEFDLKVNIRKPVKQTRIIPLASVFYRTREFRELIIAG